MLWLKQRRLTNRFSDVVCDLFFFLSGFVGVFSLSESTFKMFLCGWRLCDLVPERAGWTFKGMPYCARHTLAVSWFKSIVLVTFIIPEMKRITQATCLALFLAGKRSCRLMSSYKIDIHKSRNQVGVLDHRCVSEAILDESWRRGERGRKKKGKTIDLLVPHCWKHSSPGNGWLQALVSSPTLSACLWFKYMI